MKNNKKEEKKKLGRPRLADKSLKKNALIMIVISIILIIVLVLAGSVTTLSVDTNKLKGALKDPEKYNALGTCSVSYKSRTSSGVIITWSCSGDIGPNEPDAYASSFQVCECMDSSCKNQSSCSNKVCSNSDIGYVLGKKSIQERLKFIQNGEDGVCSNKQALKPDKKYFVSLKYRYHYRLKNGNRSDSLNSYVDNLIIEKYNEVSGEYGTPEDSSCVIGNIKSGDSYADINYSCGSNSNIKVNKISIISFDGKIKKNKSIDQKKGTVELDGIPSDTKYTAVLEYKLYSEKKTVKKSFYTLNKDEEKKQNTTASTHSKTTVVTGDAKRGFAEGNANDLDIEESKKLECSTKLKDFIDEYWYGYIVILAPIALIILATIDITKAVIASDADALKKSANAALKRTIAVIILLFLPFLLNTILGWFGLELCL